MTTAYREGLAPADEADRSVLVVGLSGKVIGVSRAHGQLLWSNDLKGGGWGTVYVGFRFGILVVSADGNRIFRVDYQTGRTIWEQPTTGSGRASILVEPDFVVVIKNGYLDAFTHEGERLWSQKLEGMGIGRAALAFPGNVAQADDYGSK